MYGTTNYFDGNYDGLVVVITPANIYVMLARIASIKLERVSRASLSIERIQQVHL